MRKRAKLLDCTGSKKVNQTFLKTYQKAILLALEKEGVLSPVQREACVKRLDSQHL